jgi:hypothetical protein
VEQLPCDPLELLLNAKGYGVEAHGVFGEAEEFTLA